MKFSHGVCVCDFILEIYFEMKQDFNFVTLTECNIDNAINSFCDELKSMTFYQKFHYRYSWMYYKKNQEIRIFFFNWRFVNRLETIEWRRCWLICSMAFCESDHYMWNFFLSNSLFVAYTQYVYYIRSMLLFLLSVLTYIYIYNNTYVYHIYILYSFVLSSFAFRLF